MNNFIEKSLRNLLFQGFQFQNLLFRDIPKEYNQQIDNILDQVIKKVFSKFIFKYFSFININNNDNDSRYISFIFEYLANFKFIIYDIQYHNISQRIQSPNDNNQQKNNKDSDLNIDEEKFNLIICSEGQCLIIEYISILQIQKIVNNLKKEEISLINICCDSKLYEAIKIKKENMTNEEERLLNDEMDAQNEVISFCDNFRKEILRNEIVEYLLPALIGYLIRRYYCPTNYFKDPSFFNFENQNQNKEKEIKAKIDEFLKSPNRGEIDVKLTAIINEIKQIKNDENKETKIRDFHEDEFIKLRTLYTSENASFYFVIHLDNFYTFMMKEFHKSENNEREIDFCRNCHHRCMTKFYGFLTKNRVINGFLYEFQSNGPLSLHHINDNIYSITTIIRLFHSIKYLQSKELIHRDIKPSNIFVNHDNIPFISDYDRIRSVKNYETNEAESKFTKDFGNSFYSSPEQDSTKIISYETDIFSFGLIIYYLFEKEHMFNSQSIKKEKNIKPMTKGTSNIQELYEKCVVISPEKRININEISEFLKKEMKSFTYFEDYLLNNTNNDHKSDINDFIYEKILFFIEEGEDVNLNSLIIKQIIYFQLLFLIYFYPNQDKSSIYYLLGVYYQDGQVVEQDNLQVIKYFELASKLNHSKALLELGNIYAIGKGVKKDYLRAIEYYKKASKLNNSNAFLNLGNIYLCGKGVKQDYSETLHYYESAAKLKNSTALFILGCLYEKGEGVKQDYSQAIVYYDLSSKLNNSSALLSLGNLYINGFGVKQDYSEAIHYYESAAKLKNSTALFYLGCLYEKGEGVKQDYLQAINYYEKASKLNNSDALLNLGNLYFNGKGVKQDYSEAIHYYESAAKLKNSTALFYLGCLYEKGEGVKQDYSQAIVYYDLSSRLNNSNALINLGYLYANGKGVKKDYSKAIYYYELASKLNNSYAQFNLGYHYANGKGVEQDYSKAIKYLELSAKLNNSYSFYYLGYLYANGKGVKQDYSKAIKYLEQSAKLNNNDALFYLGNIYANGEGVKRDYSKAITYYESVAKLNYSNAFVNLGIIYEKGYGVKQDYSKAMNYFDRASKLNNSYGFYYLGLFYERGYGVKQDYSKAIKYYEYSSRFNDSNALLNLGYLYADGKGVEKNNSKAIKYFELSSQLNNSKAHFMLGVIYSTGSKCEINIPKSIEYYLKSIKNERGYKQSLIINDNSQFFESNIQRYISYNNLGLIYHTILNDYKKGLEYVEKSALEEYPFGQNNYGLFFQFYIKDKKNARYMYERSSKHKFPLAEYNLGYLEEEEGHIEESIKYYIQASEHEDEPLIYRGIKIKDEILDISKAFIISYTNLKLAEYYLSKENYSESKKYFIKTFRKPTLTHKSWSHLKSLIHKSDDFNLINLAENQLKKLTNNQINKHENSKINNSNKEKKQMENKQLEIINEKYKSDKMKNECNKNIVDEEEFDFKKIFDNAIKDSKTQTKENFKEEIKSFIMQIKEYLYTPPYSILFGRMMIYQQKTSQKYPLRKNLTQDFFDGFGIPLKS